MSLKCGNRLFSWSWPALVGHIAAKCEIRRAQRPSAMQGMYRVKAVFVMNVEVGNVALTWIFHLKMMELMTVDRVHIQQRQEPPISVSSIHIRSVGLSCVYSASQKDWLGEEFETNTVNSIRRIKCKVCCLCNKISRENMLCWSKKLRIFAWLID